MKYTQEQIIDSVFKCLFTSDCMNCVFEKENKCAEKLLKEFKGVLKPAINIQLDEGAYMPLRAHETDAGLDLRTPKDVIIPAKSSAVIDTGVHVELPQNTVGMLKSKSGLNVKYNITSEGVIDCSYTGSIVVKLYNHGNTDYKANAGDKITQLVIMPIVIPTLNVVDKLEEHGRGNNGFGSSGR